MGSLYDSINDVPDMPELSGLKTSPSMLETLANGPIGRTLRSMLSGDNSISDDIAQAYESAGKAPSLAELVIDPSLSKTIGGLMDQAQAAKDVGMAAARVTAAPSEFALKFPWEIGTSIGNSIKETGPEIKQAFIEEAKKRGIDIPEAQAQPSVAQTPTTQGVPPVSDSVLNKDKILAAFNNRKSITPSAYNKDLSPEQLAAGSMAQPITLKRGDTLAPDVGNYSKVISAKSQLDLKSSILKDFQDQVKWGKIDPVTAIKSYSDLMDSISKSDEAALENRKVDYLEKSGKAKDVLNMAQAGLPLPNWMYDAKAKNWTPEGLKVLNLVPPEILKGKDTETPEEAKRSGFGTIAGLGLLLGAGLIARKFGIGLNTAKTLASKISGLGGKLVGEATPETIKDALKLIGYEPGLTKAYEAERMAPFIARTGEKVESLAKTGFASKSKSGPAMEMAGEVAKRENNPAVSLINSDITAKINRIKASQYMSDKDKIKAIKELTGQFDM